MTYEQLRRQQSAQAKYVEMKLDRLVDTSGNRPSSPVAVIEAAATGNAPPCVCPVTKQVLGVSVAGSLVRVEGLMAGNQRPVVLEWVKKYARHRWIRRHARRLLR